MSKPVRTYACSTDAKENLRTRGRLREFFAELRNARRPLLLLDYDGTLAPFTTDRDNAVPYAGLRPSLTKLINQTDTRVVVISGRSANDLPPLLGLESTPEIWGAHGWERLIPAGVVERFSLPVELHRALDEAETRCRGLAADSQIERKAASVAVHWRGLARDEQGRIESAAREAWEPLADGQPGLELQEFNGGLELRAVGRDKGTIVELLLEEGADCVAYLGDDLTDEDAFAALKGRGLTVLVRPEQRASAAELWLQPPEELFAFLELWTEARTKTVGDEA